MLKPMKAMARNTTPDPGEDRVARSRTHAFAICSPFVTQKLNSMMEVHNEDIAMTATSLWPDDGAFGRRRNNGSFSITHERDVTL